MSRRVVAPQGVDEEVGRDDLIRVQQEDGEQRALLLAAELQRLAVGGSDFERPEDPELRHTGVVPGTSGDYERPLARR